jgi:hypothetical protein
VESNDRSEINDLSQFAAQERKREVLREAAKLFRADRDAYLALLLQYQQPNSQATAYAIQRVSILSGMSETLAAITAQYLSELDN